MPLSDEDIQHVIEYARRKFSAEPYPDAPALKAVREALAKIEPTTKREWVPPRYMRAKQKRR